MNSIIEKSLTQSYSYSQYKNFVTQLTQQNKTTGSEQREELIHYSKLNQTRMNRLDKTIIVIDEVIFFLKQLTNNYTWVVLTESWCGDAAQILPIINKMAAACSKINLRIVLRDDNLDLMNLFLTNGTKSIPKLIIIDEEANEVINTFGPRPIGAKQLLLNYKAQFGSIDEMAKIELQKWYFHDKGVSIQKEIVALLRNHLSKKRNSNS